MRKLKILLTNNHLEYFLGSELWLFTMARELQKRGHEVSIFTYLKGIMLDAFSYNGMKVIDEIEDKYDIAIMNHNSTLIQAPKSAYKIFTCHGPMVEMEQPIDGADTYVSVSNEVYDSMYDKGYPSTVICNPINLDLHKNERPVNDKLKNVLLLSNKISVTDGAFHEINTACKELDLNLTPIGINMGTAQWETEKWINCSDLVISMGRGIYEAMACERNVIVAGYGGLVGFLDEKNYPKFVQMNCSGRMAQEAMSSKGFVKEFLKYNPKQGIINRELIKKNHNVKDVVDRYLSFYYFEKYGTNLS